MGTRAGNSILEVCVDSAEGLLAAVQGGADRIELCAALDCGGLTPTVGLMRLAARQPVPCFAMIRPRAGDFVFSAADKDVMLADIEAVRQLGLAGVVLGALQPDRRLDEPLLRDMMIAAQGLGTTLHRAFDLVPDLSEALETAMFLGFGRILTSGGRQAAPEALDVFATLQDRAKNKIALMPGGGMRPEHVPAFHALGIRQFHASCRKKLAIVDELVRSGFAAQSAGETSVETVTAFRQALSVADNISNSQSGNVTL
ncbi:copper homeostasis protein CutC [Rhizobium paknamense]|uniref:PF03932 family protein CutC n=1 Tax=Rhizobium paknamense TaxID=1206817 RepID=A0ABU0IDZ7_9HYPH|nr:copper homeostasis protein CutC [Rhizobium paknamense]MDQ0456460.1 copper homeostasis protein [Rhizobium paknamense]